MQIKCPKYARQKAKICNSNMQHSSCLSGTSTSFFLLLVFLCLMEKEVATTYAPGTISNLRVAKTFSFPLQFEALSLTKRCDNHTPMWEVAST